MKIAVFLPNWVGDAVMATPTLRAIRREYRHAEIVSVMRPYVAEVLAGVDLVDRHLLHDPAGADKRRRGWRFAWQLRRERFDLALLLPNSLRTGWLAYVSGAPRRVGFDRDGRGLLLTDAVKPHPRHQPTPCIDQYLRLAEYLGCQPNRGTRLSQTMELATTPQDERSLEEFWGGHDACLRRNGYVCLNPGGAFGSAKHWPTANFASLACRIADELNKTVLVLCGPNERGDAREIVRRAGHPYVVSLSEMPTSLGLTKAAIKQCDLLVTTDSGPRHFAQPFGTPVVTLFGPTHIAWSETYHPLAVHLQLDVECGPCQQRTCPLSHHKCMRDLTVERVFTAVVSLLHRCKGKDCAA